MQLMVGAVLCALTNHIAMTSWRLEPGLDTKTRWGFVAAFQP